MLPNKADELIVAAYEDLITFGKLFIPGDFRKSATPQFHYEIARELIAPSNKPCAIVIPRGHAKFLRLDQPVLTDNGWKKIADVMPGNKIYGSNGKLKEISGLSDVMYKDKIYKVVLRDGKTLIVSDDHLWTVRVLNGAKNPYKYQTKTTEELLLNYKKNRTDSRYNSKRVDYTYAIDNAEAIEFSESVLPIDPYTLGVMIGDGSLKSTPRITSSKDDIEELTSYIPYETRKKYPKGRCPYFSILNTVSKIRELGLDVNSHYKFIPKEYLNSSVDQRLELLRGLMDTDGTLSTKSSGGKKVYFCTVSEKLAKDVMYLVRSLGGTAIKKHTKNGYGGYYRLAISIKYNPFRLKRKAKRFVPHDKLFNAIVSIEQLPGAFCRCLKVDSEDELFVAGDFMLTHNTTLTKAKIIRDFCFSNFAKDWGLSEHHHKLFYGWVSSNQKKSIQNVHYIRLHLQTNERIHYYFGKQIAKFLKDNEENIITGYGDRLLSSSNLSSMRGDTLATVDQGALRYSGVFIDDAENEDNTRTQMARDKIKDNIMNGIYPAIEKRIPGCRMFLIETPVHFDAFAQNILDDYAIAKKKGDEAIEKFPWRVISYKATQPDMEGGVLWHSHMPRKVLDEIKEVYRGSPRGVGGYYQEYELEVQNQETAMWTRSHIKYHEGYYKYHDGQNYLVINNEMVPVKTYIGCDPATDIETKYADFSVIMVIAVDERENIYVLDYERHRNIPTSGIQDANGEYVGRKGVVDYLLELYKKYHCSIAVVEDVAMNRSIFQAFNDLRAKGQMWDVAISPMKPGGREKLNRIYSGLNSKFSNGLIWVKKDHYELIDEIVKFGPKMAHDDTIESLYYATLLAAPPRNMAREDTTGRIIKKKRKPRPWWM